MKMKAGFSLDEITVLRIKALAVGTRRDKSTIVDMAVELLAQQEEFADIPMIKRPARRSPDEISGVKKGAVA